MVIISLFSLLSTVNRPTLRLLLSAVFSGPNRMRVLVRFLHCFVRVREPFHRILHFTSLHMTHEYLRLADELFELS